MIKTERGYKFETTNAEFDANGFIGIDTSLNIAQGYDGNIDVGYDETEVNSES